MNINTLPIHTMLVNPRTKLEHALLVDVPDYGRAWVLITKTGEMPRYLDPAEAEAWMVVHNPDAGPIFSN